MLEFVLANWDTISLLVTNVIAYLLKSPLENRG
jgi:hypothetical protein